MEINRDIIEKIGQYRLRAGQLVLNAEGLIRKGELEKAGEFLWGSIACYINCVELLHTGKAHSGHKEMVIEAKNIATVAQDTRLFEAIVGAEKLHANYYHSIIPEDEFPEYYDKAKYAFVTIQRILGDELASIVKISRDG